MRRQNLELRAWVELNWDTIAPTLRSIQRTRQARRHGPSPQHPRTDGFVCGSRRFH
jgi:hypothetical protein